MGVGFEDFFDHLVAAADEASEVLKPNWSAADSIYLDYKPEQGKIGGSIDVVLPRISAGAITNAGRGSITLTDPETEVVNIPMNQHPSGGFMVSCFDEFRTPQDVRRIFLDNYLTEIKNYIDRHITSLFNSTNFSVNSPIATTNGLVTVSKFMEGRAKLMERNVNVEDPRNMSFLLPATPYNNTIKDPDWANASIVGNDRAEEIREMGVMRVAYGAAVKYDQNMPAFGTSPTRTWTAAYLHRYSIALTTRPLPEPDPSKVKFYYTNFASIPILIEVGYQQQEFGRMVTIHAGYGLAVVRPEMCQLFSISEGS